MGWIEMNEKTKKAQKAKTVTSLADRYSFGHKALSVVLSVVLLGFGWPAVNPAEVFANSVDAAQSEAVQDQASEQNTAATQDAAPAASEQAPVASSEQAVEASSANQAADANAAASSSAAAGEQSATQPSVNKASSTDAAAQAKTEYDIALELNNASIKKADGTDAVISLPATKVTVPAGNDFKFTVVPDNGYKLNRVLVNVGGQQSPLAADDSDVYTIEASAFEAGVTITLETEKDAATAQPTVPAQPITDSAVESGSDGETNGNDAASAEETSNADSNGTANKEESNADDAQAPEQNNTGSLLDSISGFLSVLGGNAVTVGNAKAKADYTVKEGETITIKGSGNYSIWTSSDNSIATVSGDYYSNDATVTGKKAGTVTITHEYYRGWTKKTENFTVEATAKTVTSLTISGASSVNQFETTQLTTNASDVTWTSSNENVATVDQSGNVKGIAQGTATITAKTLGTNGKLLSATKEITVNAAAGSSVNTAYFYFVKPGSLPSSNDAADWYPAGGAETTANKGSINTTGMVTDGSNAGNSYDNVANRVTSWPSGLGTPTNDGLVLSRDSSYWDTLFEAYKGQTGITNKDDVKEIILHPYKISKPGNYHLDCTVEVVAKSTITAEFNVWYPGGTGYTMIDTKTYRLDGDSVSVPETAQQLAPTMQYNGVTYKLYSWYDNQSISGSPVSFPVSASSNVKYYAKYVAQDQTITVKYVDKATDKLLDSKTITGLEKGQLVTESPKDIEGYEIDADSDKTMTATAGTDSEIVFYYNTLARDYTVKYVCGDDSDTWKVVHPDKTGGGMRGDKVTEEAIPVKGYTAIDKSGEITLGDDDNTIVIHYKENKGEAGYYLSVPGASWSGGTPLDLVSWDKDLKYKYNYGFARGDTFTVTTSVPVADGKVFIGWLDKERNGQASAIRKAGDTVTYIYSDDQGYCLDALWASLSATGEDVTYDGESHGVSVDAAINDGSNLKDEYKQQAKEHVQLSDVEYSYQGSDGWTTTAPSFVNAGDYPVSVRANVSVDGASSVQLTASTTVKIAKRPVTLTSETASKPYDGTPLTKPEVAIAGDGFVESDGVTAKATGSVTRVEEGEVANAIEVTGGDSYNKNNYDITYNVGNLSITDAEKKYEITVTAASDDTTYDGESHAVSGVTGTTSTNDKGATFTVEGLSATVSGTDAGEYANKVTGTAVVKDAQGNDVTSQFNVKTEDGKLIIAKRNVTLVSEPQSFTYDGQDHNWQKVNVDPNSDGFANGEGVTYKDFASIKDVGTKDNSFGFDWSNAKEQNYNISKRYGTLSVSTGDISKYVTLKTTDVEEAYNGESHVAGEATATDANGNNLVVEYQKADGNWTTDRNEVYAVNVGDYGIVNVRVSSPANYGEGNYVTDTEKLVVKPVDIELTAKSDNQPYNGTALTNNGYDITNGAFVNDEGLNSVTVSGSQLEVGSSSNVIDAYVLKGNTKAGNYNITTKPGTLEVTASQVAVVVTIEGNKNTQKYDGTEKSASGFAVVGVTVDGQESRLYPAAETDFTFSGTDTATRTDAGTTNMGLVAGQFANVNKNFSNVSFEIVEDGSVTVTPREVTLTSATDEKPYDGTALTNSIVTVSGDGFAQGEGFTANVTGSQTDAGSSDNTFTHELTEGTKAGNYQIRTYNGTLTVKPISDPITVTIVGNTATGPYNGKELTAEGYTFASDNKYYTQDKVAFSGNSKVARTDAGKTEMGLTGKFANADTTNFTNVTFVVTDGYVDISKAAVTLKSADRTKQYDGTALVNGETALEAESGFAEGEGATYTFTGSQTVVGSSANAFSYTLNENTKADNYNITKTEGTLTVTNRDAKYQITVKANSGKATYDGKPYSATGVENNKFTVGGNTYTVSGLTTEDPTQTNAGTYSNNIIGTAVVTDAQDNDVTSEFEVMTENGSLIIDKATVTMKSASDKWPYDGHEHIKHEMESVTGFAEGEGATFTYTGAITNVGEAKNTYTYTLNANTNADNYTFAEPEYGTLTVNPVTDKVIVTIKGKQDTKTYNGFEQSVVGYDFSADNKLYAQSNVKFDGDATAKGTAVGTYNMNLTKEQFSNTNENFSNVEFVVEDGWLKITGGEIDQNGVVWNTHDNQRVYEGTPLAAYAATATDKYGNALNVEYSIDGKTWTSDPSQITITHYGYQEVQLRATNSNYAEGQYATSSEGIAITKRLVTLTSEGGNKPYDGTPLTNGTVTATPKGEGVGFIDGEGVSFNVTGSQTEAGESDNTFTYAFNERTNGADYLVTTKYGKLIVTADDTEVVVTITEKSDSFEYDGNEKSVSGYDFKASNELYKETDFTFSGNDTVKGTNVGTYNMELKPGDFTNNNKNFSKVTFVIVDGQLTITPKSVVTGADMSVKAPADVTYNGQPQQEKPLVKDGEKTLIEGTDYTLSYSKDTTNAGTVTVTVTGKGNYSGSVDVTYQILKRSVTLTSATDSKPYDGTALTRPNVTVTGDGFVGGEVTNIRATGTVSTVAEGEVANTIVYDAGVNFKADNYNITKDEGKLSITALSAEDGLDITPNNVEYTYNAESHSAGSAGASASVPGTNVSLEYHVKGSPDTEWRSNVSEITAINAGTVTIEVRASAANYTGYKYAEQTLTIKKRDVGLTSASASKVYDGAPLTKDWVDMGPNRADTGFIWTDLAGDGQVHATGSQTVVGTSDNTISYQLKEGAANNYNILPENLGTLTVTAQSIVPDPKNPESYTGATISNPSDSVYNGKEHKWTPEVKDAKGNALVEGTDYTVSYGTSDFIDAKTITVTITGTGNYTGTATKTYKITPAPLTVNAESDSKVYDGEALTAGGTIEGLVGDEKASAKTEGSQIEVGSSENKVVGIEWGTAKESNYYIQSQNDGTLTVTGKSIAASDMTVGDLPDVSYNGTEQVQKPEVKDGDKTLVEGTDYDLTFSEDKTNVGTVTVTVAGKGNYTGEVTRTYQITLATLTVTTPSDSKTYDGDALTAEGAISGFVNGETADFKTTGTQTEVGSSTNTYAIDWAAAGSTAKQGNYTISESLGTLTVTETTDEIVATPGSYNGIYDGQAHGVDVTVTGLPKGYSVKSAASYATATDVTDGVTANVDDLVIVNTQGEDVTANLKVTKGTGTIKISPATLKVTTHGAKAEYTGSALTADGKVTGFVNNEVATFATTGSQTKVGSSTNTYTIDWNDTAKESNYTIEEDLGTLEVTQNQTSIMVIPQGGSKPYDGTELTSAGVTTYGLPAGYTLTAKTKGSVTNVGGATAEVDTYTIKNAAGGDVTDQFGNVFTGKATLQVTKRPVTVASASASKVYDGTALTKHEANVTAGSLAEGESFSYEFSGEQTTVGSTSNAYNIKAGANTDLNNYEITKVDGTLTVTAQSINPTDPTPGAYAGVEVDSPSNVTYDANEHKWTPEVKDAKGNALVEGTDYDVSYTDAKGETKTDFTNVTGAITVTITGKGNYTGTVTRIYQITPASVTLSSNSHEFIYTGEPQGDATVNVTGAAELFQSQVNDLKATGSVTNVGDVAENSISYNWNDGFTADNYSIETSFGTLSVVAKSIDTGKDMSVNDPVNVTYNGGDQTWAPTVNDGEKTLVEGSDYTVSYSTEDRTNVTGAIAVTIVGKGNYTGSIEKNYRVLPKGYNVTTATGSKVYDGKPLKGSELEGNAVDGLVNSSDATFEVTGSQTEVGGTPNNNTYELTFASEQMAKNYTLAGEQLGTLTVTEYADEIVVTTTGGTFTYDGQAHGATVLVSELPEGYTLEEAASSASATNVADGKVVATADTLVIRNAQGKDVTDELKIRKIDGEIQIIPAPLSIETGSATKTYDGSALTNATLRVDGLVAGDVVTGRTTGSQTEVGSSANTYTLTWGEVDPANYEISEQLGVLTVEAAVAPVVPGPQQPNGPVVVPPTTPEPAGPADVVADALEGAYETVTGDKVAEEQIYDSENPLGKDQAAHCWVHWYMILVMILTALYGVAVWLRRGNHTRKLKNDMNDILGGGDDGKDPSGSPVATSHPAGMEA